MVVGVGTRPLRCFLLLGHVFLWFCFPSGIGKVAAEMTRWNKVSSASPYLDGVQFGINEGRVGIGAARSVGSLRILTVGVFIKRSNWLVTGAVTLTSSFVLFCGKV